MVSQPWLSVIKYAWVCVKSSRSAWRNLHTVLDSVCVCVCVCVCVHRESVASALQTHMSNTMETHWKQTHQKKKRGKSYKPLKKVTLTTVLYLHSFCMCWLVSFSHLQIQRSHVRDKRHIRTDETCNSPPCLCYGVISCNKHVSLC